MANINKRYYKIVYIYRERHIIYYMCNEIHRFLSVTQMSENLLWTSRTNGFVPTEESAEAQRDLSIRRAEERQIKQTLCSSPKVSSD